MTEASQDTPKLTTMTTSPDIATVPASSETSVRASGKLNALGWLVLAFRIAVAALFLFAAYHKLWGIQAPQVFSDSVRAFRVTDDQFMLRLATSVTPWVEVVASIALLVAAWSRAAAATLGLMLIMFTALIVRAISNGYDLECGCFGDLSPFCPKKVSWCNVVQNVVLLAMTAVITLIPRSWLVRQG